MRTTLIERQAVVAGLTVPQTKALHERYPDDDAFADMMNQLAAFTRGRVSGWTDRYDTLLDLYLDL